MNRFRTDYPLAFSAACGALYGISLRLLYWGASHLHPQWSGLAEALLPLGAWVMTFGFIVGVPFVMGWICAKGLPPDGQSHWARWIFTPWLAVVCCLAVLLLFAVEGWICAVMALPIMLVASSAGASRPVCWQSVPGPVSRRQPYASPSSPFSCPAPKPSSPALWRCAP